jgi:hypothetical protein
VSQATEASSASILASNSHAGHSIVGEVNAVRTFVEENRHRGVGAGVGHVLNSVVIASDHRSDRKPSGSQEQNDVETYRSDLSCVACNRIGLVIAADCSAFIALLDIASLLNQVTLDSGG